MLADHFVRDRRAGQRDVHHVATRRVHGLADRFRHFVRLAGGKPHLALPIAHRDERVEREPTTTLHDLRHAVDRDHVFDEIALLALLLRAATIGAAAATIATALSTLAAGTTTTTGARATRTTTATAAGAATSTTAARATTAGATTGARGAAS